jgi:uncharacterized membrane protein
MLLQPERSVRIGTVIYGFAMLGFGLICVMPVAQLPQLEPLPDWLPAHSAAALITAAIFLVAGALFALDRRTAAAAIWLGSLFAVWLFALHLPRVIATPRDGGAWVLFFEVLALGAVPWLLAGVLGSRAAAQVPRQDRWRRVALGARLAFGFSLLAFGCSHFYYVDHVAGSIPAWIPAHVFFAYFTGVAHIAGGLSVMSRIQARLAGRLLSIMFGSWLLLIWVPFVMAAPTNRAKWMNLCIAVAMCGVSLIMGEYAARRAPAPLSDIDDLLAIATRAT